MAEDPIPAIRESQATGEIAELFADIRETLGVAAINLVWRHIATLDGGLRWAWGATKPLYASGAAEAASDELLENLVLPKLPALTGPVLAVAGVDARDRAVFTPNLDT